MTVMQSCLKVANATLTERIVVPFFVAWQIFSDFLFIFLANFNLLMAVLVIVRSQNFLERVNPWRYKLLKIC